MLTSLKVFSQQGDLLTLTFREENYGIIVSSIAGLDPVKATIVSSSFAQLDGSQYQSSRREERHIILKLDLIPDYITTSVEDLRRILYSFFMPKSMLNLNFVRSDGLEVTIAGMVETFETELFDKDPSVIISITCFNPDFEALDRIIRNLNTNATQTPTIIDYVGSVETGVEITVNVGRTLAGFTIYNTPADNAIRSFDLEASLINGDKVNISTIRGKKKVTRLRAGVESSLLYAVSPYSNWIELFPGNNSFVIYASGAAVPYTLTYPVLYGGL